jgi:hypothetical protein
MKGHILVVLMVLTALGTRAYADGTITIHLKPDKEVMQLNDTLKVEVWAKLDPGVGAQVLWNPGNGNPLEWGTVMSTMITQFWITVGPQQVVWEGYILGPNISFPGGVFKSGPNAVVIAAGGPGQYQDDTLLVTLFLKLKAPQKGILNFVPHNNTAAPNAAALKVASKPTVVGDPRTIVGVPLQIQVVEVTCTADCDVSGTLDIDDFICFMTNYSLGDPAADCDASGSLTIDDFICFQTSFVLGC